MVFALALREENQIGSSEGVGRFTENSTREDVAVAEGILPVHQEKVEAVAESEVLVAIVEE
jgi:F0F1-type ATP synthase epsilon subunit